MSARGRTGCGSGSARERSPCLSSRRSCPRSTASAGESSSTCPKGSSTERDRGDHPTVFAGDAEHVIAVSSHGDHVVEGGPDAGRGLQLQTGRLDDVAVLFDRYLEGLCRPNGVAGDVEERLGHGGRPGLHDHDRVGYQWVAHRFWLTRLQLDLDLRRRGEDPGPGYRGPGPNQVDEPRSVLLDGHVETLDESFFDELVHVR